MIKLVILDFDGTLCSTHEAIKYSINSTFEHFGLPSLAPAAVEDAIRSGVVISEVFSVLCEDQSLDAGALALKYREIYDSGGGFERTTLFPGVKEGLVGLNGMGCRLVVLSNKGEAALHQALENYDLSRYFEMVLGDSPERPRKPNKASYEKIIAPAFCEITADETLVVGDTAIDLRYARNMGGRACWARYGFGDEQVCLALNPHFIIDSFAGVVDCITSSQNPACYPAYRTNNPVCENDRRRRCRVPRHINLGDGEER